MKFCFVDESGGGEPPDLAPSATPVMAIAGLIVDSDEIRSLTQDFVRLKIKHFAPKMIGVQSLDFIKTEVKGTQLLSLHRNSARNYRRQASRFLSELMTILETHGVQILGRIWVKAPGASIDVRTRYGYAVQDFARNFEHDLRTSNSEGIIVADSREHALNVQVAHSIFTQKWRAAGDPYPRINEVPLFAASDNHAGLQIADHVATTLLFPMATAAYGLTFPAAVHVPDAYRALRENFAERLGPLLRWIKTTDMIAGRPSTLLLDI